MTTYTLTDVDGFTTDPREWESFLNIVKHWRRCDRHGTHGYAPNPRYAIRSISQHRTTSTCGSVTRVLPVTPR